MLNNSFQKVSWVRREWHISNILIVSADDDENKKDEFEVLQMAYIDLDLAKSIASTIKSDLKQRSTLIKSASSFSSSIQVKQVNYILRYSFDIRLKD